MNHSKNEQLQARKAAATPRGVGVMAPFFAERARGAELWDAEGRRFIDFAGGIAVMNVGHGHPKVIEAVEQQLYRFTHTCYQVVPYEGYVSLAEKLNALTPGTHAKKTALFSTGAEAVENAIKIARYHTRRSGVIAFGGAFHGRSLFAVSLTGKVQPYKAGFGPFPPEIYHAPFPAEGVDLAEVQRAVEHLFKADIEPERVAAIIFEPVQGEGGFNVIQPSAVHWLRELCDRHGIVMIADEVQSGFGRTGTMFAMEHYGVTPDLMTIAKSLAAGLPLSAVTGRAEIMDAPLPGGLGGTYAGSPLACAAALAVLEVFDEEKLLERSKAVGQRLKDGLTRLAGQHKSIQDVRGLGAMVAVELFKGGDLSQPDADLTKRICAEAIQRGLILLSCGTYGNVIRVLVPLTATDAQLDEGMAILAYCLKACGA
jgi:4-aminobutyrate aminotransferase